MRAIWSQVCSHRCRAVDAEHGALALLAREAGDHAGLRRPGHRAHDDRVEEESERGLLVGDLAGPACEPVAAERVVGGAGRDRVRLAAALADVVERLFPALAEPDVEARVGQPHVGAHDPREEDVADLLVAGVVPVDPVLLHEHAGEAEVRRDRRDLARVVRLDAADRDERVAALRERVGSEVLELAHLVAAVGEAGVAVLALGPDLDLAAEVLARGARADGPGRGRR